MASATLSQSATFPPSNSYRCLVYLQTRHQSLHHPQKLGGRDTPDDFTAVFYFSANTNDCNTCTILTAARKIIAVSESVSSYYTTINNTNTM